MSSYVQKVAMTTPFGSRGRKMKGEEGRKIGERPADKQQRQERRGDEKRKESKTKASEQQPGA